MDTLLEVEEGGIALKGPEQRRPVEGSDGD